MLYTYLSKIISIFLWQLGYIRSPIKFQLNNNYQVQVTSIKYHFYIFEF